MEDPTDNDVRTLSERFGLSIKRIDAILRLKGLEAHWKEVSYLLLCFELRVQVPRTPYDDSKRLVLKT